MKKLLFVTVLFAITTLSTTAFAAPCTGNEARGTTCNNATTGVEQTSCGGGLYLTGANRKAEYLDDNCGGQGSVTPVGPRVVVSDDKAGTKTETSKELPKSK